MRGERYAETKKLDVVGFYHSHPDDAAVPSRYDLDHAWPFYSYLIVSVEAGRIADARSWRLADDRSQFDSEPFETVPASAVLLMRPRFSAAS